MRQGKGYMTLYVLVGGTYWAVSDSYSYAPYACYCGTVCYGPMDKRVGFHDSVDQEFTNLRSTVIML